MINALSHLCHSSGDSANAVHFQAYLLDGLVRWNENRAASMAEAERLLRSYGGPLQRSLEELSREVLDQSLFEDYTRPREYTGENSQTFTLTR